MNAVELAARTFVGATEHALYDKAGAFACREAEAVRDFYLALGFGRIAAVFMEAHAILDEPGDRHYKETPDEPA